MGCRVDGQRTDRGVDRQSLERRRDLVGIERARLLDRRFREHHADIAEHRPLRGLLRAELLRQRLVERLVERIVRDVPKLVAVGDDVVGILALQLPGDLVRADLAAGDPFDVGKEAERAGLLHPGDEMRAPQTGQHAVAAGRHDLGDEGVEVGGAELRLQGQHDLGVRRVFRQRLQDARLQIVAVGVVELQVADLLQPVLARQPGHRLAFDIGVGGGAEDVFVQLVGGHLDGFGNGRQVDDLFLPGDLGHPEPDRRAQAADDDIDTVLGDQLLHRRGGGGGVHLVVALERDDLAPEDAALGVQLVHGQLMTGHRGNAVDGATAGQRVHYPDLDWVALRQRAARQARARHHKADDRRQDAVPHCRSPPLAARHEFRAGTFLPR